MCAADVRPASMRRPEMRPAAACPEAYSTAVPAKSAAMSAKASVALLWVKPASSLCECLWVFDQARIKTLFPVARRISQI
jgi:hypothetical protein